MKVISYKKTVYKGIVYYICDIDTAMSPMRVLLSNNFQKVTWKTEAEKQAIIKENN